MNTRLLMELRVEVGVAQEIGAVPAALVGRCRWLAGPSMVGCAVSSSRAVAPTGCWLERTVDSTRFPRNTPDRRRRTDRDAFLWPAARTSGCDRGARPRRARGSESVPDFRTTVRFETADPAYGFLNRLVAVASGDRRATGPIYSIYQVL